MNDFIRKTKKLQKLNDNWPKKAGAIAVKFSKERFVRKNWVDRSRKPWSPWSVSYARSKKHGAGLLMKSGRLKRSIRKTKQNLNSVTIGTDVPYAQTLNDGVNKSVRVKRHTRKTRSGRTTTVKAHKRERHLPARPFIGESALLQRRIERMLEKEMKKILR